MRKHILIMLVASSLGFAKCALGQIPAEVQADLLLRNIAELVQKNEFDHALGSIAQYRDLDVEMPPPLLLMEAKLAYATGDNSRTASALEAYLRVAPREGQAYEDALALYEQIPPETRNDERRLRAGDAAGNWRLLNGEGSVELRSEGQFLRGELASENQVGTYELELQDDLTFEGTLTSTWTCPYSKGSWNPEKAPPIEEKICETERRVQLISVEPNRIEGRFFFSTYPANVFFNNQRKYCEACGSNKSMEWHEFVWIKQ